LRSARKWIEVPATIGQDVMKTEAGIMTQANEITAPKPPAEANTWFITVTDDRGAMVSATVQFSP
jgi:hypothetical protein